MLGLGSAFIKLGQLLSARPDVLPAGYVEELSHLQDQVPSFPFAVVQARLEEELGERCAEIVDLEERPLGSASLAQVHRASLRSGRQVVFKIQRPGLERLFRLDLEVMQQVAAVMQRHPRWGEGRDWVSIAQECRRVLLRELDFRLEAEHAARFRQQFLDDSGIRIPAVIWELSTRRVLCLDSARHQDHRSPALVEAASTRRPWPRRGPPATCSSWCASASFTPILTPATWRWPPMAPSSTTTSG